MTLPDPSIYGPLGAPSDAAPKTNTSPTTAQPGAPGFNPSSTGVTLHPGQGSPQDVGFNGNVPGIGEDVAGSFLGYYGANGMPGVSNNAQGAYTAFQSSTPANMSMYYDNAQRNATNDINKQMAARGQYGSSNAVGTISNATTNLRAQQAKDEAQYGLSRASLAGSLARGSDESSAASSADERAWVSGLSDLGFKAQREATARYELGNEDAKKAADTASGIAGSVGAAAIQNDQALFIQMLEAQGMSHSDAVTAAQNRVDASDARSARTLAAAGTALSYFV